MEKSFAALLVTENSDRSFKREITKRKFSDLPDNDVLIKVHYSALNYKDALSASGHKGISRYFPHTPGVDASGVVESDRSGTFNIGDQIVITGHDLGMNTSGGMAEYISVPATWCVHLPDDLTLKDAMIYGTHGMTAAMSIRELIDVGITPERGKILVTGATGGVGSFAVGILAKLGYEVIASTGKIETHSDYLKKLGASEIIHRDDVLDNSGRPLLSALWVGAIDNVGGHTLTSIINATEQHGAVCIVGLVDNDRVETTVYPFLLRGIKLIGIDSAERSLELKKDLWQHLATDWKPDYFDNMSHTVSLDDIIPEIDKILKGGQVGKVVVDILK
jgi:acrylyl-CoA reductase (NADPH)